MRTRGAGVDVEVGAGAGVGVDAGRILVLALARAVMRAELAARMRQVSRVPQVAIAGARLLYLSRRPQTR